MVIATSNGPCLRVSHGSVPVSAKATSARLPASRTALANMYRAEGAGRQEHDLAVGEMRRQRARDVVLRGRRRRTEDQLGAAHRLADVGRDERRACASWRPAKSLTMIVPPAARCAATAARSRRHSRTSWPGQRQIARRRERAVAAAEHRDPSVCARPFSRSTEMLHLAQALRGSCSTNTILARHLEAGELRQQTCFDAARRVDRRARAAHHVGDRHLLPFRIGRGR